MLTFLAIVAAIMSGASLILHAIAPRTENTWDDKVEEVVDEVLKYLGQVDSNGQPADHKPPFAPTAPSDK
jgi:hypothetical protein